MTEQSPISAIEQAPSQRSNGYRLIALPAHTIAPLRGRDGSPWRIFPLSGGQTLLAISDDDFHDLLLDWAAREHRQQKTSDLETVLIRRLATPGEIDQAQTLIPQFLAAQEAHQ